MNKCKYWNDHIISNKNLKKTLLFAGRSTSLKLFVSIETKTGSDSIGSLWDGDPPVPVRGLFVGSGPSRMAGSQVTDVLRDVIHYSPEIRLFYPSGAESSSLKQYKHLSNRRADG